MGKYDVVICRSVNKFLNSFGRSKPTVKQGWTSNAQKRTWMFTGKGVRNIICNFPESDGI